MFERRTDPQSRLSFDARNADGSPRLFAGMFRPPLIEVDWQDHCNRRHILSYLPDDPKKAWLSGTFDRALYIQDQGLASAPDLPRPEAATS